jgi:hypothetical protein
MNLRMLLCPTEVLSVARCQYILIAIELAIKNVDPNYVLYFSGRLSSLAGRAAPVYAWLLIK